MSWIDNLKENLVGAFNQVKEKVQESSAYNQAADRFENLTPPQQRLTIIGVVSFSLLVVLYFPYSSWSNSVDLVSEFESSRDLMRELLQATKEASDTPNVPRPPSIDQLRSQLDSQIRGANLLPEQIKGINTIEPNSKLIPKTLSLGGLQVQLNKLNLQQIVTLGSGFQNISPSVKVINLKIEANREDARYFDLMMSFISLKVPEPQLALGGADGLIPPPSKGGFRGGSKPPSGPKAPKDDE